MSNSQLNQIQLRREAVEETMEILADKKTLASIKKSLEDIKTGRYKDYLDVKQLRREFERPRARNRRHSSARSPP